MAKLEHLLVVPTNGLGNRIRVLASAKRFHRKTGVPCTILWDWPDYGAIFESDPTIDVAPRTSVPDSYLRLVAAPGYRGQKHLCIPLDGAPRIAIATCHSFGTMDDTHYFGMQELLPWLPQPSANVREKARAFRDASFPHADIVGLHIRRTDSDLSILISPSWKFLHQARAIATAGAHIYLAADSRKTEERILRQLNGRVLIYPKNPAMKERWPREPDLEETIQDYTDLLLLASCDYVLGSAGSTFSSLAMALNGSPRCSSVEQLPLGPISQADRRQARRDAFERAMVRLRRVRRSLQPGIGLGRALRRLGVKVRP